MSTKTEIFNYLKKIGCCNICNLRYLNARSTNYLNVEKSLLAHGIDVTKNVEDDEPDSKRVKENDNICVACLDLFNASNLEVVLDQVFKCKDIDLYECDTILSSISLPILLNLRRLSIWMDLINKFPKHFSLTEPPDASIKDVIKLILNPKICEKLQKTLEVNQCGIMINLFFEHEVESSELKPLWDVKPEVFNERYATPRKFNRAFMTRNAFDKHFNPSKVNAEIYAKYIPVPPAIPETALKLNKITVNGPTIFVAGRYRKLSRSLSQTPWILQGKRVMEESVSEIIIEHLAEYFGVPMEKVTFSSSGREDVDVRCLGKGRPFVLEIPDSRKSTLPQYIAGNMESVVERSQKVSIRDIQLVKREELINIKQGEENKKKMYRALCVTNQPVTVALMEKLNITEKFTIQQVTPIRVLHRRPWLNRQKQIYEIKASFSKDNPKMIILDVTTQAGTYVKELVHGEFGRTFPSVSSIIDQWIDIVALDVMRIDLNWPPEVDNKLPS